MTKNKEGKIKMLQRYDVLKFLTDEEYLSVFNFFQIKYSLAFVASQYSPKRTQIQYRILNSSKTSS